MGKSPTPYKSQTWSLINKLAVKKTPQVVTKLYTDSTNRNRQEYIIVVRFDGWLSKSSLPCGEGAAMYLK